MIDISDIETRTDNGIKRYVLDSDEKIKRLIDSKFEEQDGFEKYINLSNSIIRNSHYNENEYLTNLGPIQEDVSNRYADPNYRNEIRLRLECENSILYNVDLSFMIFRNDVSFIGTIFVGKSIFIASKFCGNSFFNSSVFCSHDLSDNNKPYSQTGCNFASSIFKGHATFEQTKFSQFQISFERAIFERDCTFEKIDSYVENPSKYTFIKFSLSKFKHKVAFREISTNKKILFEYCEFEDNVAFYNNTFKNELNFNCATFYKKMHFLNSPDLQKPSNNIEKLILRDTTVCKRLELEYCEISILDGSYMTIENGAAFRIYKSTIDSLEFNSLYNKGFLMLDENGSSIKRLTLQNSQNIGNIEIEDTQIETIDNRKTARILKDSAYKSNNTIDALKFKRTEMLLYKNEVTKEIRKSYSIDSCKSKLTHYINYLIHKPIWEYILLKLNTWSNDNGLSWGRGLVFTSGVALLFFTLINFFGLDGGEQIFVFDFRFRGFGDVWKGYLQILNVFNFRDVLPDFSLNAWGETLFLLSKIFISYGIYQTVSAFRKYGK